MNKKILNFKPQVKENFIVFKREEKNGNLLIKTTQPYNNEKLINKTFDKIISLADGNKSIEEIIENFQRQYSKVDKKLITNDILNVISELDKMQAFENKDNPFRRIISKKLSKNYTLNFLPYCEQNEITNFVNSFKGEIEYKNPYLYVSTLESMSLKRNNLDFSKGSSMMFFGIKNSNQEIVGLLEWNINNSKVELNHLLLKSSDIELETILNENINLLKKLDIFPTQIQFFNISFTNSLFVNSLTRIHFHKTSLLIKELKTCEDVEVYQYKIK